jgi:hypothetical protein
MYLYVYIYMYVLNVVADANMLMSSFNVNNRVVWYYVCITSVRKNLLIRLYLNT